jgi:hypothetical protein
MISLLPLILHCCTSSVRFLHGAGRFFSGTGFLRFHVRLLYCRSFSVNIGSSVGALALCVLDLPNIFRTHTRDLDHPQFPSLLPRARALCSFHSNIGYMLEWEKKSIPISKSTGAVNKGAYDPMPLFPIFVLYVYILRMVK